MMKKHDDDEPRNFRGFTMESRGGSSGYPSSSAPPSESYDAHHHLHSSSAAGSSDGRDRAGTFRQPTTTTTTESEQRAGGSHQTTNEHHHHHETAAGAGARGGAMSGPTTIRVRKFDSWARMVAYEACWQVCLQAALGGNSEAEPFLSDGCKLLKSAFGLSALVLQQPGGEGGMMMMESKDTHSTTRGGRGQGNSSFDSPPRVIWEDSEDTSGGMIPSSEVLGSDEQYHRYTQSVRECLKVEVLKVTKKQLGIFGRTTSGADRGGSGGGNLFVVLRPRSRPEDQGAVIRPDANIAHTLDSTKRNKWKKNKAGGGDEGRKKKKDNDDDDDDNLHRCHHTTSATSAYNSLFVSQAEASDELLIDLWDDHHGLLGRGAVPMNALWSSLEEVEDVLREVHGSDMLDRIVREGGGGVAGGGGMRQMLKHHAARLVRLAAGKKDPPALGALRTADGGARHKVHLVSDDGTPLGKVTLALWRPTRAESDMSNGRQAGRMCEMMGGGGNHSNPTDFDRSGYDGQGKRENSCAGGSSSWNLVPEQAYDLALLSALKAQGCKARKLTLEGPWRWLLGELARRYQVKPNYTALTYLKWALQPQHATPTEDCFRVLLAGLQPLKEAELSGGLTPSERTMLKGITQAMESLVAKALESYRLLSEEEPLGLLLSWNLTTTTTRNPDHHPSSQGSDPLPSSSSSSSSLPAPALRPALALFGLLRDPLCPNDQQWLTSRFQTAARRRYLKLESMCSENNNNHHGADNLLHQGNALPPHIARALEQRNKEGSSTLGTNKKGSGAAGLGDQPSVFGARVTAAGPRVGLTTGLQGERRDGMVAGATSAEREYRQLEALSNAIRIDLEGDIRVQEARVLPSFIKLPQLVAEEYCKEFVAQLQAVLRYRPPYTPSAPAVRMLVSVGRLQACLGRNQIQPAKGSPGHLEARSLFSPHVLRWLEGSEEALLTACKKAKTQVMDENAGNAAAAASQYQPGGKNNSKNNNGINHHQQAAMGGRALHLSPRPSSSGGGGSSLFRQREARCRAVEEVVSTVNYELSKYEQVICHWPIFGCSLERMACVVMREAMSVIGAIYGGLPSQLRKKMYANKLMKNNKQRNKKKNKTKGGGGGDTFQTDNQLLAGGYHPNVWEAPVDARGLPKLTLSEAKVLNAFKALLHWIPEVERRLAEWCGGRAPGLPDSSGARPRLGEQFAQLKKEAKLEYSAAVKNSVERMSGQVGSARELNITAVLAELQRTGGGFHQPPPLSSTGGSGDSGDRGKEGLSSSPLSSFAGRGVVDMERALGPFTASLQEILEQSRGPLNARVHVSIVRGMWDSTCKEIFHYVEHLQEARENGNAWKGRTAAAAALDSLDQWFQQRIAQSMGMSSSSSGGRGGDREEKSARDLEPPYHSEQARKLVGTDIYGNISGRESYSVY